MKQPRIELSLSQPVGATGATGSASGSEASIDPRLAQLAGPSMAGIAFDLKLNGVSYEQLVGIMDALANDDRDRLKRLIDSMTGPST